MNQNEITLIKQAIINEIEGYEFYKLAAAQTDTAEAKTAFGTLAQEEFMHVDWLKKVYNSLKNDKVDDYNFALMVDVPETNIFKWENVDRKNASLAVSVFGIGVQMERESIKFYQSAAQTTENEKMKRFYHMLVQWEQRHLDQFEEEYKKLKEEWWNQQDFAPM